MDPELDFLSSDFNASKALLSSSLSVPCPEVQPCDNLDQYLSVVKGTRKVGGSGRSQSLEPVPEQKPQEAASTKRLKSVLDLLKEPLRGPLALLQDCQIHQIPVQILTRHSRGLRGMICGNIIAFDRHFNMILRDVTEHYTPLKTVGNRGKTKKRNKRHSKKCVEVTPKEPNDILPKSSLSSSLPSNDCSSSGHSSQSSSSNHPLVPTHSSSLPVSSFSSCQKRWECTRYLKQLFIRGDNVILVRSLK
ncbi:PREDICTED: U7 snRNA-associated Sm-like protein LSm11 [Amphimedon queenslandica]|nr:PREDICTED: U7 snRNA-associated Sm-like protein LSm11 [Amphimedon queenslandica]|eukprot:XP_011403001.2 PREDICTED: U7 snRNA-associated Sm-like protein LSm11 [Amphimedon queenslandica]